MANKKISQLTSRTPSLTDLLLVGDPATGFSYKTTVTDLATVIQTDIADAFVTLDTTQTISGAKTFSNALTLTSVADAGVDTDKFLVLNAGNVVKYRTGTELLSDIGGQASLTLTTTGSSGASTLVGATLNIPTYTLSGLGGVPTSRTLTINGTAYDLSADRSWSVGTITGSGTTNYLAKFSGSTAVGSSRLYDDGTNTIYNVNASSGQYAIQINANTTSGSSFGMHILGGTTSSDVAFKISNAGGTSEFLRVLGNGNLGLGVTNPVYKLDVNGVINTSSSLFAVNAYFGTSAYGLWEFGSDSTYDGLYIRQSGGSGTSGYVFGIDKDSHDFTINGKLILTSTLSNGTYTYTLPSATGTLALTSDIPSLSGYVPYTGATSNVDLGSYTLTTGAVTINGNGNELIMTSSDANGQYINFQTSGGSYGYVGNAYHLMSSPSNVNTDLAIRANTNLIFAAGGSTERMRITSGGLVGIGVTNPATKLQVYQSGSSVARFGATNYVDINSDGFDAYSSGSNMMYLNYYSGGGIDFINGKMRLTSGGNLGIGTTTPSYQLTTTGRFEIGNSVTGMVGTFGQNTATADTYIRLLNTNGNFDIGTASSGHYFYGQGTLPLLLYTNATERMRITSGGNVLIGTTTDAGYKLDVNGTGRFVTSLYVGGTSNGRLGVRGTTNDASAYAFEAANSSGNTLFIVRNDGAATFSSSVSATSFTASNINVSTNNGMYDAGTNTVGFQTNGAARMYISSGGNVLVGSTTDNGSKFQVNGGISTSRLGLAFPSYTGGINWEFASDGTSGSGIYIYNSNTGYNVFFNANGTVSFASLGTGTVYSNAGVLTNTNPSDSSLKNTIKPLTYGLAEILQLQPKTFYYNSDTAKSNLKYGFIAQDVQPIMPDLVRKISKDSDKLGLETDGIYVALVNAIKELKAEIEELKKK